ncbi:uncharacterized protein JCM10292_005959 [Rhodotorula paludigena]|uniref:uncharacterized protein n=1 Tax=Rhodotorula paludigena TaxID=86838 RepID=UPI0031739189
MARSAASPAKKQAQKQQPQAAPSADLAVSTPLAAPGTTLVSIDPDASASASPAVQLPSPALQAADRTQLRVVVDDLAPALVLEQQLTVPSAPAGTLRDALADEAPLLPISVLRACVNEAATSALLSSAMAMDATEADSARLLNDVDEFQRTILGLLDELEQKYEGRTGKGAVEEKGIKREAEEDGALLTSQPPSKVRRYMLHRTLATGVDLFTSAAVLSDADLEALAKVEDTDLIAVHPPSASSLADAPVPRLGDAVAARPDPPFPRYVAPTSRVNRAPGQHGVMAKQRLEPTDPYNPARQPTHLLSYPSPFLSSLAPTHDSTGATEPYTFTARRALRARRVERYESAVLSPPALPAAPSPRELDLSAAERETLRELGVEVERFLERGGAMDQAAERARVWELLERNVELIKRVGRAQIVRTRRGGETKGKGKAKALLAEEVKEEEGLEENDSVHAKGHEKEDAAALLASLTSLVSHHSSTRALLSSPPSSSPSLLPNPAFLRALTPLLLAARAREPSYGGTLDPANWRALRDAAMSHAHAPADEGAVQGMEVEPDLQV